MTSAIENRDLSRLLARLNKIVAGGNATAEIHQLKAKTELVLGRYDYSLESIRKAVALEPHSIQPALTEIQILDKMGDPLEAWRRFCALAEKHPESSEIWLAKYDFEFDFGLLADANETLKIISRKLRQGRLTATTAESKFYQIEFLSRLGWHTLALSRLERFVMEHPTDQRAFTRLGQLQLWHGRYLEAERNAACALRLDKSSAEALRIQGAANVMRQNVGKGLTLLNRALTIDANDREAYVWRGEAKRLLGRTSEALIDLEKADPKAFAPMPLAAQVNKALIEFDAGRRPSGKQLDDILAVTPHRRAYFKKEFFSNKPIHQVRALKDLLRMLAGNRSPWTITYRVPEQAQKQLGHLFPNESRFRWRRIQSRIRYRDLAAVLRAFDDEKPAAKSKMQLGYWLAHRGELLLWFGQLAKAREHFESALQSYPHLPWPHIGLSAIDMFEGNLESALKRIVAQTDKKLNLWPIYVWNGEIRRRMGDYAGALKYLELDCVERRPGSWINYALTLGALGKSDEQRRVFNLMFESFPYLFRDAAKAAGVRLKDPRGLTDNDIRLLLETSLEMMKGNRSSWCFFYFKDEYVRHYNPGRLNVIGRVKALSNEF